MFAPIASLFDREREAIELIKESANEGDTFSRLALAFVYAHDKERPDVVMRTYHDILKQNTTCDARIFALHLLLMLRRPALAQQEAQRLLESSEELVIPYKAHIKFLAGGSPEELQSASPNYWDCDIALKAFADGDDDRAREYFEKTVKGQYLSAQFWWAKVYLAKLDKVDTTKNACALEE